MATIREVAERAQVSQATVSHVINNTRFVSSEVRERVMAAIAELEYQQNSLAKSLRSGKTLTIGLLLPDSANPYFAEIGKAVEDAARHLGYSVILCNTEGDTERESFYLDVLYQKRVDGIILVSVGIPTHAVESLQKHKLPLVAVDRDFPDYGIDSVLTDNLAGAILATRHLINLGHRRIACITGPSFINPSSARITGYLQALQEAGISADERYVVTGDFHPESGWKAAMSLLSLNDRPTAILTCNDLMAFGVLRAAAEMGLRVPEDLALVGYDDIELAAYYTPALTTVAQPKNEMSQMAVEILVKRINGENGGPVKQTLQPVLVIRKSCGMKEKAKS